MQRDIVRQHLFGLHRIDLADAEAARMVGEDAVPKEVGQHTLRAIVPLSEMFAILAV
ncbi:MAG TPA: hypothetical protein VFE62_11550 [Gemmataceae bacterium]|nr:hypothetical protein [Gemmataceae bacterium]